MPNYGLQHKICCFWRKLKGICLISFIKFFTTLNSFLLLYLKMTVCSNNLNSAPCYHIIFHMHTHHPSSFIFITKVRVQSFQQSSRVQGKHRGVLVCWIFLFAIVLSRCMRRLITFVDYLHSPRDYYTFIFRRFFFSLNEQ